jgi:flagellar motor switch/type III secretory pathway protein FliN
VTQDLVARLNAALGYAATQREDKSLNLAISLSGREAVTICIPEHAFVAVLKKRLGPVRKRGNISRPRLNAAGPIRVDVRGILGNAELSLIDLKDLSIGDVLILDRSLAETVELQLGENRRAVGHGKLSKSDGRVSIRF